MSWRIKHTYISLMAERPWNPASQNDLKHFKPVFHKQSCKLCETMITLASKWFKPTARSTAITRYVRNKPIGSSGGRLAVYLVTTATLWSI